MQSTRDTNKSAPFVEDCKSSIRLFFSGKNSPEGRTQRAPCKGHLLSLHVKVFLLTVFYF